MNDVIVNKVQGIQRCIARAREEYGRGEELFRRDFSVQDSAVLNVVRACELSIDLANHLVRRLQLGIPNSSAESFELLARKSVIPAELAESLKKMTGFRNIAVHDYQALNLDIVESVIRKELNELVRFTEIAAKLA
jgi:uncharacterized protein YutE (UPF0331/DUF86 family)